MKPDAGHTDGSATRAGRLDSATSRSPLRRLALILAATAALGLLLAAPAVAKQVRLLEGTFGSAAQPTFTSAAGLAVDTSTGDLLVIDAGAGTVSRYNPDGTPAPFSALGSHVIDGSGSGNCPGTPADCDQTPQDGFFFNPLGTDSQVVVDDSGTPTDGNIYVTQYHTAGGSEPGGGRAINAFAADGHFLGQLTAAGALSFDQPCGVAVDASGFVYIGDFGRSRVFKFDPSGPVPLNSDHIASFAFQQPCTLAAGAGPSAGSLFAARYLDDIVKIDSATGAFDYIIEPNLIGSGSAKGHLGAAPASGHAFAIKAGVIREYDASGPGPILVSSTSVDTVGVGSPAPGDRIYVSSGADVEIYGQVVAIPDVLTTAATITALDSATLNGDVDPDGEPVTACHFEYIPDAAYDANPPDDRFAGAADVSCAEAPASIGSGTDPVPVHADVGGLDTDGAVYHYRLVAANTNDTVNGNERTLTTPDEPAIEDSWTGSVQFTEATVKAQINPKSATTTFRVEWGPDTDYGDATAELPVGSDDTVHTVSATIESLVPDTTYHFRVVATNALGVVEGPDGSFTTFQQPDPPATGCPNQEFRTGTPSAPLPDCRAYEMVSPPDKDGGDISDLHGLGEGIVRSGSRIEQATPDGDRLTYSSYRAFADPDSASWVSQYLASRDPEDGWSSDFISPPRDSSSNQTAAHYDQPYDAFAPDLCTGFLTEDSDVGVHPGDHQGWADLYRRTNCDPGAGSYELITTVSPAAAPPTTSTAGTDAAREYTPRVQGFSADGARVLFRANENLTPNASSAAHPNGRPIHQLYLHSPASALRLVSVLPSPGGSTPGAAAGDDSSLGNYGRSSIDHRTDILMNAVSADGTRVFWSTPVNDAFSIPKLYLRLNADRASSPVSGGECTDPARACTLPVSESVSGGAAQFLAATPGGERALFRFFADSDADYEELYSFDAATETPSLIADGVLGILGASDDLSSVYLVSTEVLDAGATAGQPNLYLWRQGAGHRFIASLADGLADSPSWAARPFDRFARVAEDGQTAVFTSTAPLTGFDNRDAVSGLRVDEIFRYDAAADGGSGELRCISCNPTGSRPAGGHLRTVLGPNGRPSAGFLPPPEHSLYDGRILLDGGDLLFFESFDRLVPADTNGRGDVYQWRAEGGSGCDDDDAAFAPDSGGCLSLISTGTASKDARFADASADGSDVFFLTDERLHGSDPDGVFDIYDARSGGGFPAPPPPAGPCDLGADECQDDGGDPPADPGSGSSALTGPGNAGRDRTPPATCPKGKRLRNGKCVGKTTCPKGKRLRNGKCVGKKKAKRKRGNRQ